MEKQKGNEAEYRKQLEKALDLDAESVNVLIECYRLPATTPESKKFHEQMVRKIEKAVLTLRTYARNRSHYSSPYKPAGADSVESACLMARLILETEGDLNLATTTLKETLDAHLRQNAINKITTVHRAIDFLARCYYKKGDVEKAVPYARKAMETAPHDKQIQKTWDRVSEAYEKKTGKRPEPPKSGTERFRMLVGLESE